MIKIFAVIPTFNRKEQIHTLLGQLSKQILPQELLFEIVVVINGLYDGTIEMIQREFPTVHILKGHEDWWYTKSMNEGFKYIQRFNPNFVLTLNDDIEISHVYLSTLLGDFQSIGNPNSILGSMSLTNGTDELIFFSGIKKFRRNGLYPLPYIKQLSVKYNDSIKGIHQTCELPGRGILIPNQILMDLNYFDEKFIQYGSDTDFCFRVLAKNMKIYISWNAIVRVNIEMTRIRINNKKVSVFEFLKSTFNIYSHDSIKMFILFHMRHYTSIWIIWKIPYIYIVNIKNILKINRI